MSLFVASWVIVAAATAVPLSTDIILALRLKIILIFEYFASQDRTSLLHD
jgi:hypothetical protein